VEAGPPRRCRLDAVKSEIAEIECIDEGVDHADRVVLVDPVVEALRQPSERRGACAHNLIVDTVLSRNQGAAATSHCAFFVRVLISSPHGTPCR
jgi:hypothetical protein